MNNKWLVSIITPCFNGEEFIDRFFESVLKQTYSNIELVFINDGSTDNTEKIALSYKTRFEKKGIRYTYLYQDNKGQAAAINMGLNHISGEFFTWPDSDDRLDERCIEIKVKKLVEHPEWGMVCCRTAVVNEKTPNEIAYIMERKCKDSHRFFEDLIKEHDVYFAPGGYMVRTKLLLNELKDGQIYEGRGGQNWQLLLPVAYRYECGFIDDVLYYYYIRENGHSRQEKDYNGFVLRTYEHEKLLCETILRLKIEDTIKQEYLTCIEKKYAMKRYVLAFNEGEPHTLRSFYNELKKLDLVDYSLQLDYWEKTNRFIFYIIRSFHLFKRLVKNVVSNT